VCHIKRRTLAEGIRNMILKKVLDLKRKETTGDWRTLHNGLIIYDSNQLTFYLIKSRKMNWMGHIDQMGDRRNIYKVLVWKHEKKKPLGRPEHRWGDNAFFHSVMSYGIIFWGNSSHSSIIFRIPKKKKKKAIKIMEGCGNRVSCRNLFKKLQILPFTS